MPSIDRSRATSSGVVRVKSAASACRNPLRQVGHRGEVGDAVAVDPAKELVARETADAPASRGRPRVSGRSRLPRSGWGS